MAVDGLPPKGSSIRSGGGIRLAVEPLDREALLSQLRLGHTVKGRIIQQFDDQTYLLRLLGYNLVAESETALDKGTTIRFRVRALNPKIDLQILDESPQEERSISTTGLDRLLRSFGSAPDEEGRTILRRMLAHGLAPSLKTLEELREILSSLPSEERPLELEARLLLRSRNLPESEGNLEWARLAAARPQIAEQARALLAKLDPKNTAHQELAEALRDFMITLDWKDLESSSETASRSTLSDRLESFVREHPSRLERILIKNASEMITSESVSTSEKDAKVLERLREFLEEPLLKEQKSAPLLALRELVKGSSQSTFLNGRDDLLNLLRLLQREFSGLESIGPRSSLLDRLAQLIKTIESEIFSPQNRPGPSSQPVQTIPPTRLDFFSSAQSSHEAKTEHLDFQLLDRSKGLNLRPLLLEAARSDSPSIAEAARNLIKALDSNTLIRNFPLPATSDRVEVKAWTTIQIPLVVNGQAATAEIAVRRQVDEEGRRRPIDSKRTTLAFALSTSRMGLVKASAEIESGRMNLTMTAENEEVQGHLSSNEEELRRSLSKSARLVLSRFEVALASESVSALAEDRLSLDCSLLEGPEFLTKGSLGLDVVV